MKCLRCGFEVTPGNSRITIKNGRKFREHKKCQTNISSSERQQARLNHTAEARLPQIKPSEPETHPASERKASVGGHRYFVMPFTLEKLERSGEKALIHSLVNIEVHTISTQLLEVSPELTGEMIEIFIRSQI